MAPPQTETGLVPTAEAAKRLGKTVLNLLMHIKQGRLEGREVEGEWHVTEESLTRFAEQPHPARIQSHCGKGCGGGCREK